MARRIPERVSLPRPPRVTLEGLHGWAVDIIRVLVAVLSETNTRANQGLPKDGTEPMTAPLELETFTLASRPAASDNTAKIIFVSDGTAGNKFQGSDGASWLGLG